MKLPLALLSMPLGALVPLLLQDPAPATAETQDGPVLTRNILGQPQAGASEALRTKVRGCWRLMDVAVPGLAIPAGKASGFLLLDEHFLSLEIQASWGTERDPSPNAYQTVIGEYFLDQGGLLTCRSLMGSYLDEMGVELVWEPAGQERMFNLEMPTENMLVLRSLEGPAMTFARNLPSQPERRSITGERLDGPEPELDILGQPEETPAEPGETDIFGRPKEKDAGTSGGD